MKETITIQFDGGSRGNPGNAGIGFVLAAEDGTPLVTIGRYIGTATNNVAEYMALIGGLEEAGKFGAKKVRVVGDSELIIKQMRGEYRVKNPALRGLYEKAAALARTFESVSFGHRLREENSLADKLANLAMDKKGEVTDVDETPSPAASPSTLRRGCPNCGCQIEIVRRPDPSKARGKFVCTCGTPLE